MRASSTSTSTSSGAMRQSVGLSALLVIASFLVLATLPGVDGKNVLRPAPVPNGLVQSDVHLVSTSPKFNLLEARKDKDVVNLPCHHVHKKKYKDKCKFVKENCADEEVGMFDYLGLYYCALPNAKPVALGILFLWASVLFMTIGIAASDFFTINLSTIATILDIPQSVAGVTLLALGNGSPDVFSTFAAMKIDSASLAIGELIGAASFITAIVAGSIAVISPFRVSRKSFVRDVIFFIGAVILGMAFIIDGNITLAESIIMIVYYVIYVIVVFAMHWYSSRMRRKRRLERNIRTHHTGPEEEDEPYRDEPDEDDAVGSRERERLLQHDFSALERANTMGPEDEDDEDSAKRAEFNFMSHEMGIARPRMERQATAGAIRPSLVGALEFRAVRNALERNKNQFGGRPIHLSSRRYSDEDVRTHRSAPHSFMDHSEHFERYRDEPENNPVDHDLNGRARAVSVNDMNQPRMTFHDYQDALSTIPGISVQTASPTPTQAGAHETNEAADSDLLAPTSVPEHEMRLSPPSTRGTSPAGSARASPMLRPQSNAGLHLQLPDGNTSPIGSNLSSPILSDAVSSNTIDFISERRRRASEATYLSVDRPLKWEKIKWWPYSVLPDPQELYQILFPTLRGKFEDKTFTDKLISIVSVPSIFLLTITLPVAMADLPDEKDEAILDVPEVRVDSPTSTITDHIAPPPEAESGPSHRDWNRWLVGMQCILAPTFVIVTSLGEEGNILKPLLWGLVGGLVALGLLLIFTTPDHPPRFRYLLCFVGFVVAIAWIQTIANEVVGILKAVGVIFDISDAILGLTVFAMGNSLGDLVANVTFAKSDYQVMALGGCIGGPMLNILLGIGLSGVYLTAVSKSALTFSVSPALIISGATLMLTLLVLLVAVPGNKWEMNRKVGVLLIGIWCVSTVANLVVEMTMMRKE